MRLDDIVNLDRHPIGQESFIRSCAERLDKDGVLALPQFIQDAALAKMRDEAKAGRKKAYFCTQNHSVYLNPIDENLSKDHPANRQVESSKGCICDDDVADDSPLRQMYDAKLFRDFVMGVTGETALHPYADPLSSINIHYAGRSQELGWHFDNSSFAITLLIQKPPAGSRFEFVKDLRDADKGEMNYEGVEKLLDGQLEPDVLSMEPGTLVLFRGRNSVHRVSPNESDVERILAVLAYNNQPGIELSPSARMTFYGRLD